MPAVAERIRAQSLPRDVLSALPVAVYTTDSEGRIIFYNDAAAALWGRAPVLGQEKWNGAHRLYAPDGAPLPLEECPMARAIGSGHSQPAQEMLIERPDGSRVMVTSQPSMVHDGDGRVSGAVNVLLDINDAKSFELSQARFSAIVESSDDAILSKNLDGIIQTWNNSAQRLFGYTAEEAIGRSVVMLIPEDRHNEEPEIISRIRRGERVDHFETIRRRKDGTLIDISLTISPVKNRHGVVIGASKIARDISGRRRAEEAKDLLLHEIKHRVKNTLGTVQAIASQTFRAAPPQEREAFGARLRAMSEAHDLLTNQDWGEVAVGDVVARAVNAFNPQRFAITGDTTRLDAAKALLLAMAVHELGTNAMKYGALSNADGRIQVNWHGEKNRLVFEWRESGGPAVTPPSHRGFGTNLIQRAMAGEQGKAHFDYAPAGFSAQLEIRL